ncbi:TPR-like protein [Lentithecium fluviatile CBS 122367]|uniref:TPR-like protein n=1 Tax=Lentithecium fluviatile CBS 122367 TaxID=1168545 RepID=A0A6G1J4I1_9PLEO|nr:TPR-like protein [Lentithecium fluviatile CBS 122367]
MAGRQILPSTRSLEADPYTKSFGTSATPAYPGGAYSDYGFIAVLGLAQRLKIDLLPITWQALRGLIGQSRARINQALLSIQTSFAFKRFDHDNQSDPFRETVQEMAILGHPLVQNHPHIVNLIGICWDIEENSETLKEDQDISTDIQVWPVLVFEKSHFGDLYSFARSGRGKGLSVENRLKICADVGIAIRDMHLNNIIHGDIKPQNVLIFEESPGIYTAKVADFGLSTHFRGENDLINIPISVPWNAPEYHNRAFYPQDAKAMDVYSFGMLCLWLLFGIETSTTTSNPLEAADTTGIFSFEAQDWSEKGDLLLSWKSSRLLDWAIQLTTGDRRLKTNAKDRVTRFFLSSLCVNPQKRITDWGCFLSFLDPAREILSAANFTEITVPTEENFQIASLILSLYLADFRLRSFITTKLREITLISTTRVYKHILIAKAAEQLAFCYKIGFGIPKYGNIGKELFISQSQNSAVEKQIQLVKDGEPHLFNIGGDFDQFFNQGLVGFIDFYYYNDKGLVSRVETILRREIQNMKESFGKEHWLNLTLKGGLASTCRSQGRWKDAEALEVQVMETSKTKLGIDHPETLISMANLASTYWNQGLWKDAEALEVQVIERRKTKLGAHHPDTLNSMNNLALTYLDQGRWEDAEVLFMQVMETVKTKLGADHPSTLTSMANLALTYRNQGRWKDAEELEVQVMGTRKTKLEADHPDTLISMNNLASTYLDQGRWKDAEELGVQVMETRKTKLGADHPDTLTSMANLASTYRKQGRWKDAEELEVQVMGTRKTKLGADHPDTLISMNNLASTYLDQGRWKDAEELGVQVMETRKTKLGADHPSTLTSMGNLALTYWNQGRCSEAEALEVQVMETRKKKLGADHHDTLTSMANLALTYLDQGRWTDAEELEVQVMETRKTKLGADHPDTLTSMANLASTYWKQDRWKDAEALEVQVMEMRKTKLGVDHPSTLTSMANLAFTLKGRGSTSRAVTLMRDCCELRAVVLGPQHPDTISSREALTTWQLEALELSEQNDF